MAEGRNIIVCGSRTWKYRKRLYASLDIWIRSEDRLLLGGAKGADDMALDWAREHHIKRKIFRADWDRDGKRAGPLRNIRMLEALEAPFKDVVIAFRMSGISKGTDHMIRIAKEAGYPVWIVDEFEEEL